MEEFTGVITHKGLIAGDQRYIRELKTTRLDDWFCISKFIKMVTNTNFSWTLHIPENKMIVNIIKD